MNILNDASIVIMNKCYSVCGDYGLAIILFTLLSKIVLLPVSIWLQVNSIKMVKMQPEVNMIKVNFFGDSDAIAEELSKLYKREKYKPLLTLIPTVIQLAFLMAVIAAINAGMGDPSVNMISMGVDLSKVPAEMLWWYILSPGGNASAGGPVDVEMLGWCILSPVLAGVSAWVMALTQNLSNVIQADQSKMSKNGMMIFSVALSLFLGWFVALGVALYWIVSNLMAVAQLYILNYFINPKKYVDYDALKASRTALNELNAIGTKSNRLSSELRLREKNDYKRFFNVVNKHLVFYSEESGFYKYYKGIIEYLLKNTNIIVHYVTSDANDKVFELAEKEPKLRPYFIAEKRLITLMMKMDADIVVMTMPDLDNFHIKRSYVRKDIEYIYIPHGVDSNNNTMRKGSMDHYDTVFCVGKHQKQEIIEWEELFKLPKKRLVEWGYCLLDDMRAGYEESMKNKEAETHVGTKTQSAAPAEILIAPSWQKDNIIELCIDEILDQLSGNGYNITVRPHPQQMRLKKPLIDKLSAKYANAEDIRFQTDFSSNSTVFEADLVITDWSGIAYEYAYTTLKPALFINTPMKVMNPDYDKIPTVPLTILLRDKIGVSVDTDKLPALCGAVEGLLENKDAYREAIDSFVKEYVYNLGLSGQVGAKYIIERLKAKSEERKKAG